MNEKTKYDYIKLAQHFLHVRLIDKGIAVTPKNIKQALIRSAPEYRPAYWRRLRCALVVQQEQAGFNQAAQALKTVANPVTNVNAPAEIKAQKKAKQQHRKHVEKEEHIKLRDHLRAKKDFAVLAAIEIGRILGCRPAEMLTIKLLDNNKVFIEGAKKTENGLRGLDRTVTLSENNYNSVSRHKSNFFDEAYRQGRDPARVMQRIQHRLASATNKLWPKRKHQITLYSYRHQMGSDLKALGMDRIEVAAIMGHQSVDSVNVYGNRRRSSRTLSIKATTESIARVRKTLVKHADFSNNKHGANIPRTTLI